VIERGSPSEDHPKLHRYGHSSIDDRSTARSRQRFIKNALIPVKLDFQQLCDLIAALEQTDITELNIKSDELELNLRRGSGSNENRVSAADLAALTAQIGVMNANATAMPTIAPMTMPAPIAAPPAAPSEPTPPPADPKWVEIVSPMVGTFYRAPAPTEPPFVETGNRISKGQAVCIIEAMKLMNEVEAEVSGEIVEILVENGEPVEFNQPLMRVMPS
jgi:acetyl-CoA carboxylase biotin carboxyl carrier protein